MENPVVRCNRTNPRVAWSAAASFATNSWQWHRHAASCRAKRTQCSVLDTKPRHGSTQLGIVRTACAGTQRNPANRDLVVARTETLAGCMACWSYLRMRDLGHHIKGALDELLARGVHEGLTRQRVINRTVAGIVLLNFRCCAREAVKAQRKDTARLLCGRDGCAQIGRGKHLVLNGVQASQRHLRMP